MANVKRKIGGKLTNMDFSIENIKDGVYMNEMIKELKQLQALVDITNYLAEHEFTYDEADEFIRLLNNEVSASRDCHEYETADDWYNKRPCCDIANKVIAPLNRVDIKKLMLENEVTN